MDAAGLTILLKELEDDCAVAHDAAQTAGLRLRQQAPGYLEACAFELARFYNVVEKMLEHICEEFENHVKPATPIEPSWHRSCRRPGMS